ncbi:MAG: ribonuclease J [Candidatus Paceibacterota bacterium]
MGRYTTTNLQHRELDERKGDPIPEVAEGDIRIIPLSGVEEVGRNMAMIETANDIIIIDCGYSFESEDLPGIDYVLPNTRYLEEHKDKIRGLVITHGHLDHIGGIPYIMDRIGNPPIYCRSFSKLMILKRQEEFPDNEPLDIHVVTGEDEITLGSTPVRFYEMAHTIPDSMGVIIDTPYGQIINQADFELDHVDGTVSEKEQQVYKKVAEKDVLMLMMDSTNIENPGFGVPEWKVHRDLEKIFQQTHGRLIIASFASLIERMARIIDLAGQYNRKVVLEGRSMRTNVAVAQEAGLIKAPDGIFIQGKDVDNYQPNEILILATGSQGEEFAALNRMANQTHHHLAFNGQDTVVLSASVVPGNEKAVASLKDNIAASGADIITSKTTDLHVHASGHGNRGEIRWLHEMLKPKFFMPQHGNRYMLELHKKLATKDLGMPDNHVIVPENGSIVEIKENGTKFEKLPQKAAGETLTVDGLSIGNIQDVVIRDREILQTEGIFVIIVAINPKNGKLRKSPDLISRGFVYLRESKKLLSDTRDLVRNVVEEAAKGRKSVNFDYVKSKLTERTRSYLRQETGKEPLVIPVVIGV